MSDKQRAELPARPADPPRVAWIADRLEKLRRRDELLRRVGYQPRERDTQDRQGGS
ncbi:MAG: hypothetical protein KY464_02040 [Gemmatimonadetes bacterium]|nr:hypothetical protein [Gemmatimonadota bacterium]